ncbi:MAG: hypothetical protein WCF23_06560, partial [Candidatus Nitrosopolaris sp.]
MGPTNSVRIVSKNMIPHPLSIGIERRRPGFLLSSSGYIALLASQILQNCCGSPIVREVKRSI